MNFTLIAEAQPKFMKIVSLIYAVKKRKGFSFYIKKNITII